MDSALIIRPAVAADAAAISAIYAHYVTETSITFEIEPPGVDDMANRMAAIIARYPYFVAEDQGALIGYAYATELYARAAYRWVAETTIYLAPGAQGRGTGKALYQTLLGTLRGRGFYAAVGKVTLPNDASARLHEALGFSLTGRLNAVGYKLGRWHDVGLYQVELAERPALPAEPERPAAQL